MRTHYSRLSSLVITVLVVVWLCAGARAAAPAAAEYPGMHIGNSLSNHLKVLNFWGKPSDRIRNLYEKAFAILEAKPEASFADLARDSGFQSFCDQSKVLLLGGPMLGSISSTGATVWVRTARPGSVEVRLAGQGAERRFGPAHSSLESDLIAVVQVVGLQPDSRYSYSVFVDGQKAVTPESAEIVTTREAAGQTRIVFGSCFHSRLGNPNLSRRILERDPAAWLLIGDIAADDKKRHHGLARADYLMRDLLPAWQSLAARIPTYAAWDDHDYFWNDASGAPAGCTRRDMEEVRDVFCSAWNNPSCGFPDGRGGIFLRTRIGCCDVIMLDTRYFRSGKPGEPGSFLGAEQLRWLETQLLDCKGPFIIISSGTMWSDYVSAGKDSWGVWDPQTREKIFHLIETHRIPGVLLISGDRHGARGFRIPRPSGYQFYEFEAASLGGWTGPGRGPGDEHQLFGEVGKVAFGEFTFDTLPTDPEARFRLIDQGGDILYELKLLRSRLTPPGR